MLKQLFQIGLRRKLGIFYKTHEDVVDVILFGSAARGKVSPRDIDILLIFSRKVDSATVRELEKIFKDVEIRAEVVASVWQDFFTPSFLPRENILLEGISLINNKKISEGIGYEGFVLFRYSLEGFTKTKRVRFFYALSGRKKNAGFLAEVGYRLGKDTMLINIAKSDEFKDFLARWGVRYKEFETLIPKRRIVLLKNNGI